MERKVIEVDNRDVGTTWLWLDRVEGVEPERIEVNPWDLLQNLIENAYGEDEDNEKNSCLELLTDLGTRVGTYRD